MLLLAITKIGKGEEMQYSEYDKRILPLAFIIMVALVVLLAVLLRHRSEQVRGIPTAIVAAALLFIEVLKQRWNILGEFDYYMLPFHYCSLFLVVIPLGELLGRWGRRIFRPIATYMTFIVSCGIYLFPNAILGSACETVGTEFYGTHSFVFHHLVVLYFLLVVALRLYRPNMNDILHVGMVGTVYLSFALPLTYLFDKNYCNLLESALPILEEFRLAEGQVAYTVAIALFLTLGSMIVSLLYFGAYKLITLCFCRKNSKKDN